MFLVRIDCSDPECREEREAVLESLDELEELACDCGHGFVVVSVSELREPASSGAVISLPARRRSTTRRAA
jgi:hypothetical protein